MKMMLICTIIILSLFTGCEQPPLDPPDDNKIPENTGLEVDIIRINLNVNELATVPGRNPEPPLEARVFPTFATKNGLIWESTNTDAAVVDRDTGEISIRTDAVETEIATIIKVKSEANPSIYDECILTVYPTYPGERRINASNVTLLNTDYQFMEAGRGVGIYLLAGTGNASSYTDGDKGPGLYVIDPEDPYAMGISEPDGGARAVGSVNTGDRWVGLLPGTDGSMRTSGSAARMMRIPALFGPFMVQVNYVTNSGGNGRHADIRIGDKDGIRIEGEDSLTTSPVDGKTVIYIHEPSDFVPVIYIECKAGLRIHDVIVLDRIEYYIIGERSILRGQTSTYSTTVDVATTLGQPAYKWEIVQGTEFAEILGSDTGKTVELNALESGSVTLNVIISTTDPEDPGNTMVNTANLLLTVRN